MAGSPQRSLVPLALSAVVAAVTLALLLVGAAHGWLGPDVDRGGGFCEAERESFSRLLGVHVQRLATLAQGDHVCTTFVPLSALTSDALTNDALPDDHPTHPDERSER